MQLLPGSAGRTGAAACSWYLQTAPELLQLCSWLLIGCSVILAALACSSSQGKEKGGP